MHRVFKDTEDYTCYDMTTSDYRGIMFNFGNDYWTENKDIIPAVCYGIDRQAIIDAVLLGQGMPAYGALQRNIYNDENVEQYDYNPEKAKRFLRNAGCTMDDDGFYGEKWRRNRLCDQRHVRRTGSIDITRGSGSSCRRSASTVRWIFRHRWTGEDRWPA